MKAEGPTIIANGRPVRLESACTVADFLAARGLKITQVVVELNGKVVSRQQLSQISLREADRLEIIVPVAGG
jgi:thiamine biosynthesis protein ThiS